MVIDDIKPDIPYKQKAEKLVQSIRNGKG